MTLRRLALVEWLREAAEGDDPDRLRLVRELIAEIKQVQLEHKIVATDAMVLSRLEALRDQRGRELRLIEAYLGEARDRASSGEGS